MARPRAPSPAAARIPAAAALDDPLARYWAKRDFALTGEPRGETGVSPAAGGGAFVVQKHQATRLHYDLRLELDGVLVSWAVPRGPSLDPSDKRMAIHVEDHPLSYAAFEGTIPPRQYGAGTVIVWDHGTWQPLADPRQGLQDGKLLFELDGQKLHGRWELVRTAKPGDRQDAWLLLKKRDVHARPRAEYDVVSALPDSVLARPPARGGDGPPGAVEAPMPTTLAPQLATLAAAVPTSGAWSFEIKLDGYRLMARIDGPEIKLITRGGHDWSSKLPQVVRALHGLGLKRSWLDGEIVVIGPAGTPDFHALQTAFDRQRSESIDYFLFDLPYFEGHDLRATALADRRRLLKHLLDDRPQPHLRFSADFGAAPAAIVESARRLGLEGVIAKRRDSPYESRRTETWLKLKNRRRQEFVIAGYSDRSSGEAEIGSLLLAVYDESQRLVDVGSVGTGWSADTASALRKQLKRLEVGSTPFGAKLLHRGSTRDPALRHWVRPQLVAEVEFADWTPDGQVRHASFVGLRTDRDPTSVQREHVIAAGGLPPAGRVGGIKVSHPDRVIDPTTGATKLDLVRYYESVADRMLPHLAGRPCSLVRAPQGIAGELFFQKHMETLQVAGIRELDAGPGHAPLIEVRSTQALIGAAQMNVIEFHTWNASTRRIDRPDRIVFDLDPGDGERWERVLEAATLVRGLLLELELQCWLKTSGGKGLHLVVPLTPREPWEAAGDFAQAVVQRLARVIPQRFVAKSGGANRVGKIFVDYLRNRHGATTAAAYSVRARPGLGVSMPVAWDELATLKRGDQWTLRTAREHLSFQAVDPWAGYWTQRQTLTAGRKALGLAAPRLKPRRA